jgi:hypothetical protein
VRLDHRGHRHRREHAPGRAALWKIEQRYALVGYAPCDPAAPNATARAIIRDLKRAMFKTNGKAEATFGGKVLHVEYKGRNIAPRVDGVAIVMAVVEIVVSYAESCSNALAKFARRRDLAKVRTLRRTSKV